MDGIRLRSVQPAGLKRQSPGSEGSRKEGSSSCRGLAFLGGILTVFYDHGLVPNDEAGGCMRMDSVPRRIWLLPGCSTTATHALAGADLRSYDSARSPFTSPGLLCLAALDPLRPGP